MADLDSHNPTATAAALNDRKPRHRPPTTDTMRVLIADDHPLVRDGIQVMTEITQQHLIHDGLCAEPGGIVIDPIRRCVTHLLVEPHHRHR